MGVSIGEDGTVSAFVLSIGDGFSANMLATRLYSSAFRGLLEDTTLAVAGQAMGSGSGQISVGAVTFKPEAFVPPIPTTTKAVSTSTSTGTGTGMMQTTGDVSGPAWEWFVVGGVAVGAAAAAVVLLFQKARKGADELALDV